MHTYDAATGDILLHSDGDLIRLDAETAAFLLGEQHLTDTLRRMTTPLCRICEKPSADAPTCDGCAADLEHDRQHRMTSDYEEVAA